MIVDNTQIQIPAFVYLAHCSRKANEGCRWKIGVTVRTPTDRAHEIRSEYRSAGPRFFDVQPLKWAMCEFKTAEMIEGRILNRLWSAGLLAEGREYFETFSPDGSPTSSLIFSIFDEEVDKLR